MKPHESHRINKKSIRGDSWPVWNRGIRRRSSFSYYTKLGLKMYTIMLEHGDASKIKRSLVQASLEVLCYVLEQDTQSA